LIIVFINCAQSQLETQARKTGLENRVCKAFDNIEFILSVCISLVYNLRKIIFPSFCVRFDFVTYEAGILFLY
jgi:hypothetical protein